MKIRQGFVSNSSSSSFVVIGATFEPGEITRKDFLLACKVPKKEVMDSTEDGLYDLCHEQDYVFADNDEDGGHFVGERLADVSDDDGFESHTINLSDLQKRIQAFIDRLPIKDKTIKLITGTRMC